MNPTQLQYSVYMEKRHEQQLYGIVHRGGARVAGFTTDAREAARLAELYDRLELSPIHLADAVMDFQRS